MHAHGVHLQVSIVKELQEHMSEQDALITSLQQLVLMGKEGEVGGEVFTLQGRGASLGGRLSVVGQMQSNAQC
jgi:hypothetical protein